VSDQELFLKPASLRLGHSFVASSLCVLRQLSGPQFPQLYNREGQPSPVLILSPHGWSQSKKVTVT
jgi:hypothetical protein